jgi:hypothetical protein
MRQFVDAMKLKTQARQFAPVHQTATADFPPPEQCVRQKSSGEPSCARLTIPQSGLILKNSNQMRLGL